MSVGSVGLYGVVGQPLTPDYLANQLTMFEAKVPKEKQVQPFKFPTNCPPNIPSPSLFPGEVIQFQQHRVVCTEVFEEPAVGALYVTNFRIIFYGNLISDPESLDALQGTRTSSTVKKDTTLARDFVSSFSKTNKFKFSRSKNEPNFVSHVVSTDGDNPTEKLSLPTAKKIKSSLRKLGSLRRSPNRTTKPSGNSSPRPYISAPMPLIETDNIDSSKLQYPQGYVVLDDGDDGTKKTRSYFLGYTPDDVSCDDSVSVSSQSEFSMTGTDERSTTSPLGDGTTTSSSDPIDIVNVNGRVCINGEESDQSLVPDSGLLWDSSLEATLCADSIHTLDSGVNLLGESINEDRPRRIRNGTGSSNVHVRSTNSEKKVTPPSDLIDFERVPSDLKPQLEVKSSRNVWKDSIVKPESDSDTDSERSTPSTAQKVAVKFEIGSIDTKFIELTFQQGSSTVLPLHQSIVEAGDPHHHHHHHHELTTTPTHTTETQVPPPFQATSHLQPQSNKAVSKEKNLLQTDSKADSSSPYANLFIPGLGKGAPQPPGGGVQSTTERPRSKSSSPKVPKKPKPLPRAVLLASHKEESLNEELFVSSLPADFRPTRPLRPSRTHKPPSTHTDLQPSPESPAELEPKQQQVDKVEKHLSSKLASEQSKQEVDIASDEPMPIPPPRRKRGTKRSRTVHSVGSESSSTDAALTSPEEPLSPSADTPTHSSTMPSLETVSNGHSVHISNGTTPLFITGTTARSPDLGRRTHPDSTSTEMCRSLSNDDVFTSSRGEIAKSLPNDHTIVRRRSLPHIDEDSRSETTLKGSARTSHTSMAVLSSGSAPYLQRPYSVIVSPFDTTQEFNFPDDRQVSLTVPRNQNGVMVWYSPRVNQKVQKSPMPESTRYTLSVSFSLKSIHSVRKLQSVSLKEQGIKLPEGILVLCRNFHSMKLYIHPHNTYDADGLKHLMEKQFLCGKPLHQLFAFEYRSAIRHPNPTFLHNRSLPNHFNITGEVKRLGLLHSKLWSVRSLLLDHPEICSSYPPHVIVPICTPDMDLIRAASLYHENRFPTLTWVDRETGATLLRAASTRDERGHGSTNLLMDEALLGAISGCNSSARGKSKLYIFTEKSDSRSGTGFNDPVRTEQVRTYFYHNCKFVYSVDPPTFKSVRHSFNRLQALLENKLPDDQFLIALDTTHWLPRISELLTSAVAVCRTLFEKAANVLVCYEAGWDRTTQVVSLAQLLLDPYYRTMDGFQVLVQKEWVWFGHPFRMRHSRQDKSKEDGPVFLQWVDCVWQVMHQCPSAFEFNEKFLMAIVEHSYSGLFGTFMTNCEHERKQTFSEPNYTHMSVSTHTVSFWTWVSMINSAGRMFYNKFYDANTYPGIIHPRCTVPCLKLWMSHYCKYKPQENFSQPSHLQRQLEELVRTYKTLQNTRNELEPSLSQTSADHTHQVPPPLMPRDGLQMIAGAENMNGDYHGGPMSRAKPVPPPKPPKQYFSGKVEEYLRKQGLDPAVCKHIELSGTTCQGNLYKLGAVRKNWLQRWFVLDFESENLAYFETQLAFQNKEAPKGVIHLCDVTRVYQSVKRKDHLQKNIFMIVTPSRTYLIQAPSIITMECWKACLTMPLNS